MRIVCLGGGPAGLYFSILMKQANPAHDVSVYERSKPDDTFGWGIVFSDATLDNLARADPQTHAAITRNFHHWNDCHIHFKGRRITSGGHGFCGISRKKLNGILQTRTGLPVIGSGGPVTLPPDVEVAVGTDGTISTVPRTGARNSTSTVDQLKLVNPPEAELVRGGDGYFRLAGGNPAPADPAVRVASGYLEGSNVNVVEQMVTMISLARHYETQTKLLSVAQEMDRSAAQLVAKS